MVDNIVDHLPDKYDSYFEDNLPSSFRLDEHVRDKNRERKALMTELDKDKEQNSSNPEVVKQENDLDFARDNIRDALVSAADSLEEAMALAGASDSPRSWEVVATLLKTISDMNSDLVKLHKESEQAKKIRKDRLGSDTSTSAVTNQQNNYYLSSPKDIIAQLREGSEPDMIEINQDAE